MKLRKPPAGQLWLHVHRFGEPNGHVWAIQSRDADGKPVYQTASHFVLQAAGYSQTWLDGSTQPKAVIVVPSGRCVIRDGIAVITSEVK